MDKAGVLSFLQSGVTPYHAVEALKEKLLASGFCELLEKKKWDLKSKKKYFVTRNDSSIIAFKTGAKDLPTGIRMVGAHTDSPCLKVRPLPELQRFNYLQLGVEIYGGVLLSTWFDRDLSLAGRVYYWTEEGELEKILLRWDRPLAVVPNLAIHLNRDANQNRSINPQLEVVPLLLQTADNKKWSFLQFLKEEIQRRKPQQKLREVLSFDLSFFDCQAPAWIGVEEQFLASARLDNLLSCYVGIEALIHSPDDGAALVICSDHEEVGSSSACGAGGPFLKDVLTRWIPEDEERMVVLQNSLLISADNAHGVHPNYPEKHDAKHAPLLNAGPVIKVNSSQRYATNDATAALWQKWCRELEVPHQTFVARSDMGCGSTIGPITATELGLPTIDIGMPTFAMHSVRELAGVEDMQILYKILLRSFSS